MMSPARLVTRRGGLGRWRSGNGRSIPGWQSISDGSVSLSRLSFGRMTRIRPNDCEQRPGLPTARGWTDTSLVITPATVRTRSSTWRRSQRITKRVDLGSVVLCAGYRQPVVTARLAADLDHLSGARFVLGLGIGWNAAEFAQLGFDFPPVPERRAALVEQLTIIRGVWSAEPFTFRGQFHSTERGRVFPPPLQQPGPPLILAGGGERYTLRLVAELADGCNVGAGAATGSAWTTTDVARKLSVLERHCQAIGRPYDTVLRTHFTSWIFLADTEAAARAKLDRFHPHGLTEEQRHSRVVGTPAAAIAYYKSLADVGVQYFVVQTQDAADLETIELLAREVAPKMETARCRPGF